MTKTLCFALLCLLQVQGSLIRSGSKGKCPFILSNPHLYPPSPSPPQHKRTAQTHSTGGLNAIHGVEDKRNHNNKERKKTKETKRKSKRNKKKKIARVHHHQQRRWKGLKCSFHQLMRFLLCPLFGSCLRPLCSRTFSRPAFSSLWRVL